MINSFRSWLLIILAVSFAFFGTPPDAKCAAKIEGRLVQLAPDKPIELTFKDALATAMMNNKEIQMQEEEIAVARANIVGAWSEFLPKVNLDFIYDHNDAVPDFSNIPETPFFSLKDTKRDLGIYFGYIDDNQFGFSLDQVVFDGGKNIAGLRASRLGLKIQREALRFKKQVIGFEVKRLYYGLLLAYETEKIAQELVDQSKQHYEEVQRKFDHGSASRFEVLQSKVQVTKAVPELVKAENAVKLVSAELNKLMGENIDREIKATDKMGFEPIRIDEAAFRCQAYLKRPEIIMQNLGLDVRKQNIEIARSGALPQMGFSFDYYYRNNEVAKMFDVRHRNWQAEVAVRIPIFDGFSAASKINETRARYEQSIIEREDFVEQVAVEVKKACFDLEQGEEMINALRDSTEEAEEALRIANTGYENGVVTNLDVLDTQISLSQVKVNYSEALYDYIMAKAYLEKVKGEDVMQGENNER